MRSGRGSKNIKMQGKWTWPKYSAKTNGKMEKQHLGGHDLVRRIDRQGEVFDLVQKMFWI